MPPDENRGKRTAILFLVLVGVNYSVALDLDDIHITVEGRVYHAQLSFDVTSSVDRVTAVLTDYNHPDRLTPDVTNRAVVSRQNGDRKSVV